MRKLVRVLVLLLPLGGVLISAAACSAKEETVVPATASAAQPADTPAPDAKDPAVQGKSPEDTPPDADGNHPTM